MQKAASKVILSTHLFITHLYFSSILRSIETSEEKVPEIDLRKRGFLSKRLECWPLLRNSLYTSCSVKLLVIRTVSKNVMLIKQQL